MEEDAEGQEGDVEKGQEIEVPSDVSVRLTTDESAADPSLYKIT